VKIFANINMGIKEQGKIYDLNNRPALKHPILTGIYFKLISYKHIIGLIEFENLNRNISNENCILIDFFKNLTGKM